MDYSIFLLHRFHEELQSKNKKEAMIEAIEKTFSSVSASALTTVCGFLALVAMKYGIGKDMGLVLAKGVFLSLLTVITLLPILALATEDKLNKYKHKILLPSFDKSAKYMVKIRYVVLALSLLILIPAFLGQSKLSYYYSIEKTLSKTSEAVIANKKINEIFGENSELVLIVPKSDRVSLNSLAKELKKVQGISSVEGLYTSVDTALPDILIPQMLRDRFESDKYTYFVLNLKSGVEGEQTKQALQTVNSVASNYFKEHYLTGEASVYQDLNTVTSKDFIRINIISTILIGLILLVVFKSIVLPIILVFVIQLASMYAKSDDPMLRKLVEGIMQEGEGLLKLNAGLKENSKSLETLETGSSQLYSGFGEYKAGIDKMAGSMKEMNQGISACLKV